MKTTRLTSRQILLALVQEYQLYHNGKGPDKEWLWQVLRLFLEYNRREMEKYFSDYYQARPQMKVLDVAYLGDLARLIEEKKLDSEAFNLNRLLQLDKRGVNPATNAKLSFSLRELRRAMR